MPESNPHTAGPAPDPTPRRQTRPWEWAALVGLVVAVVAVLGLTGLVHGDHGADAVSGISNADQRSRTVAVQALLDTWASAEQSDDAAELSDLIDKSAAPGFLAAETRRAANISGVEFSDWGYEITAGPETVVPPSLVDALGADEVWAPAVQLRYAIAGADERPTRKPVSLVVARRGDYWTVVRDSATADGGTPTWRGPWDFGPIVSRRVDTGDGRTSVVLGHPGDAQMVDSLAGELPAAVADVTQLWGSDWAGRALVWVAESQEEFTALVGPNHDGRNIAAVAISDAVDPDSDVVTGQRIVFSPASTERLTDVTRREILRHELTHVATRAETIDGSPMWMLEGYAEYAGYRGTRMTDRQIAPTLAARLTAEGAPGDFPDDDDFAASGERGTLAYETAWSISAFVADEFGEARLTDLYRALAVGKADSQTVDGRLAGVIGIDGDQFRNRWSAWVGAHLG
ncbi:hypothetical protein [Rhodococcus marinonascens]|uniref:hypothetical protein n=1 Tax=Rhodococcus marinonascens TaxID=38311 RepID=UPI0009352E3C|nr:hypothetical protein [Rhodococcus marinonascens]